MTPHAPKRSRENCVKAAVCEMLDKEEESSPTRDYTLAVLCVPSAALSLVTKWDFQQFVYSSHYQNTIFPHLHSPPHSHLDDALWIKTTNARVIKWQDDPKWWFISRVWLISKVNRKLSFSNIFVSFKFRKMLRSFSKIIIGQSLFKNDFMTLPLLSPWEVSKDLGFDLALLLLLSFLFISFVWWVWFFLKMRIECCCSAFSTFDS